MFLYRVFDTVAGKEKYTPGSVTFLQETPTGTVDGTNATFTLSDYPAQAASIHLYLDRLIVKQSEYTVDLPNKQVTFSSPPKLGQDIYVSYAK